MDQAEGQPRCVDCDRPATKSYGTLWLCQHHWWDELCRIFARRPDLRAPTGIGYPIADYVKCDVCAGEWFGQVGDPCPHCERYVTAKEQLQRDLDRERLRDLIDRIRDGDYKAEEPAARHVAICIARETLPPVAAIKLAETIKTAQAS